MYSLCTVLLYRCACAQYCCHTCMPLYSLCTLPSYMYMPVTVCSRAVWRILEDICPESLGSAKHSVREKVDQCNSPLVMSQQWHQSSMFYFRTFGRVLYETCSSRNWRRRWICLCWMNSRHWPKYWWSRERRTWRVLQLLETVQSRLSSDRKRGRCSLQLWVPLPGMASCGWCIVCQKHSAVV